MNDLPLALTLGEPAGIGPEITVKAKRILKNECPFFVVGDYNFLTTIAFNLNCCPFPACFISSLAANLPILPKP